MVHMDLLVIVVLIVVVLAAAAVVTAVVAPVQVRRAVALERAVADHQIELRSQAFDLQLDSVHAEMRRVTDALANWQRDGARTHGELVTGLAEASRSTAALASTTGQLREALASPMARGQWGERMAEDVLRLAGFVEGVNYRRQQQVPGGGVPDLTFLLPGDQVLHMDVKFPVSNYLRSLEAATAAEREAAEVAFVRDVRSRIKEITDRGYIQRGVTVGYVLLFVPNESVYGFMHQRDPGLIDVALAQRVVLCSPFTLFAVLAVIRQAAESLALAQTSDEVLACLASFGEQWDRFAAQLELVGKRLDSAHGAFDDLAGPRRRQLQKELDVLADLRDCRSPPAESPPSVRKVAG